MPNNIGIALLSETITLRACLATPSRGVAQGDALAEALNATHLTCVSAGDAPWIAQTASTHDGEAAAASGAIGNSQLLGSS